MNVNFFNIYRNFGNGGQGEIKMASASTPSANEQA